MTSVGGIRGPRVLVLDDDHGCRARIAAILETEGYSCDAVEDAEDAATLLQRGGHALLLVDVRVAGAEELVAPSVILMTPYPVPDRTARVNGRSVDGFLEKPFEIPELMSHVRRVTMPSNLKGSLAEVCSGVADALGQLDLLGRYVSSGAGADDPALGARYLVDIVVQSMLGSLRGLGRLIEVDHDGAPGAHRPASAALLEGLREAAVSLESNEGALRPEAVGGIRERLEQALRDT